MLVGYMRVSTKKENEQKFDLQLDALKKYGVKDNMIYSDRMSGSKTDRPGLNACLKSLREGDTLVVWKLDRLGRSMKQLVNVIFDLAERDIAFKCISNSGMDIDPKTVQGKIMLSFLSGWAEIERDYIRERTIEGLESARARGRVGGRKYDMTKAKVRLAQAAMGNKETVVSKLCEELGVTKTTLYRYVSPTGELREYGKKLLSK